MQVVKQDGYKDCGVASLLSIIRYYGGDNSLEILRELTNTTRKGVSAYNLIEAAKILGFESYGLEGSIEDITIEMLPLISHIIINKRYQHFIVIYEIDKKNQKLIIMDPAQGKKTLTFAQFNLLTSKNFIYLKPLKKLTVIKTKKVVWKEFKKFLQKNKFLFLYMLIFSLLILIFNLALSLHFKILINKAIDVSIIDNVYLISILMLILVLYKELLVIVKNIQITKFQTRFSEKFISYVFHNLMILPYSYYKNRTTGEILSRIQDINVVKEFLINFFTVVFVEVICTISFLLFLFYMNQFLTLIILLSTVLIFLIEYIGQKVIKIPLYKYYRKEDQLNGILVENIRVNSINTIKNNHIETRTFERFNNVHKKYLESSYKVSFLILVKNYLTSNIKNILNILLLGLASTLIIKHKLNLATLIIFQNIFGYYMDSILKIIDVIKGYENFKISKIRIEDMFNIYTENFSCSKYFKTYKEQGEILFKNLSYAINGKKLFTKLNLQILNKEKIFFTGNSGSGKTTLMMMLLRHVASKPGNIFINNMDVNYYHLDVLRKNITYISQQEVLFTDTIKENIVMGENIDNDLFDKVCKITLTNEIINRSSLKEMEIVEENGANYSGGERQRIILARALLRQSSIYIFDEAFSQIDHNTSTKILKMIFKYLKDKTIIVISHRKPNNDLYDRILKLENGVIIESEVQK